MPQLTKAPHPLIASLFTCPVKKKVTGLAPADRASNRQIGMLQQNFAAAICLFQRNPNVRKNVNTNQLGMRPRFGTGFLWVRTSTFEAFVGRAPAASENATADDSLTTLLTVCIEPGQTLDSAQPEACLPCLGHWLTTCEWRCMPVSDDKEHNSKDCPNRSGGRTPRRSFVSWLLSGGVATSLGSLFLSRDPVRESSPCDGGRGG